MRTGYVVGEEMRVPMQVEEVRVFMGVVPGSTKEGKPVEELRAVYKVKELKGVKPSGGWVTVELPVEARLPGDEGFPRDVMPTPENACDRSGWHAHVFKFRIGDRVRFVQSASCTEPWDVEGGTVAACHLEEGGVTYTVRVGYGFQGLGATPNWQVVREDRLSAF